VENINHAIKAVKNGGIRKDFKTNKLSAVNISEIFIYFCPTKTVKNDNITNVKN